MSDKVCLLITTFNRSHLLNRSLERLTRLTLPDEILVINDGGQDNCEDTVKGFEGRLPIRYIYNHNPDWSICSIARNIGIKNTDCDIVITSEPEILFVTNVIQQMLQKHQEIPGKVISAGTIYHMGHQAILSDQMINDPSERLKYEIVNDSSHNTNPNNPTGYSKIKGWVAPFTALYRREWLLSINGWDEQFVKWGHDDTDLLTRLSFNGIGQEIAHDIEVVHQWHEKLPPNVQYEAVQQNDRILQSKILDANNPNNHLVANKNNEWGVIKNR
jgi:glycosyltransferase involved in cell wall biosynthesis